MRKKLIPLSMHWRGINVQLIYCRSPRGCGRDSLYLCSDVPFNNDGSNYLFRVIGLFRRSLKPREVRKLATLWLDDTLGHETGWQDANQCRAQYSLF